MEPGLWKRVKIIVEQGLDLPNEERDAFLASACAGDSVLKARAKSLLAITELPTNDFLDLSPLLYLEKSAEKNPRIGPYRVERELGRGGMGVVYLAHREDDELDMSVSIKLVQNQIASAGSLSRFRLERQFLADLKHPHIAMLLDAGTTESGQPYFIMEYVEGTHVSAWCATQKPSLFDLLQLFSKVVSAVAFAHARGVIHRDIKPANIMVTNDGEPKLLDFGIARLAHLEDGPTSDLERRRALTPEYASPEQKHNKVVGEASDIYSLGLVLLELLTGKRPSAFDCSHLEAVTQFTFSGRSFSSKPDFRGQEGKTDQGQTVGHPGQDQP